MSCNAETDVCNIAMNDIAGGGEPEFFANCSPLPDDCGQGDCSCVEVPAVGACYDGTGQTIIFHPGG
jgi:hypothetical protein